MLSVFGGKICRYFSAVYFLQNGFFSSDFKGKLSGVMARWQRMLDLGNFGSNQIRLAVKRLKWHRYQILSY